MVAHLPAERLVPARDLRRSVFDEPLRRPQPAGAHAIAVALTGRRPVLAPLPPEGVPALRLQRLLEIRRVASRYPAPPARPATQDGPRSDRKAIGACASTRVPLCDMGRLLAGAGCNRHGFAPPRAKHAPLPDFPASLGLHPRRLEGRPISRPAARPLAWCRAGPVLYNASKILYNASKIPV